jgi:hypothetical protein
MVSTMNQMSRRVGEMLDAETDKAQALLRRADGAGEPQGL